MKNVPNASEYTMIKGASFTSATSYNSKMNTNGTNYNLVDNTSTLQSSGVLYDRIGYYMEYAATADTPLTYVYVSMDAFTDDITKIGVPDKTTGVSYQKMVKNLEITTNVTAAQGKLTDGNGAQMTAGTTYTTENGYIEFFPSAYVCSKGPTINGGSGVIYDINDKTVSGSYGSMQVHNLDTGETVFALNNFDGAKAFGIGTNPNAAASVTGTKSQADWTFDSVKSNYATGNIYMFVRESKAALSTVDADSGCEFYQRGVDGTANVALSGNWKTATGTTISVIQASADGTNWTNLTMNSDGSYNGSLTLDGGWHYVNVRALDVNGTVLASTTTDKIGVGEIFITAGQSNSANYGDVGSVYNRSVSGNAVMFNPTTGQWEISNDPQPYTTGTKGSTWVSFAETLSERLGVPVATYSVGVGGTSIFQWKPENVDTSAEGWDEIPADFAFAGGATVNSMATAKAATGTLYGRLAKAIDVLDGQFAAILWHQGESDYWIQDKSENGVTGSQLYASTLESLIAASREEAGWDVPWGVALVSKYSTGSVLYPRPDVIAAQRSVIDSDDLVFQGPNTDELDRAFRGVGTNQIHFSVSGLNHVGQMWAETGEQIVALRNAPEPSTVTLLLLGAAGLLCLRRKK